MLNFSPSDNLSSAVKKVQIAYMQDNRKPIIASVTVNTGQTPKPPEGAEGAPEGAEAPPAAMPRPKIYRFMWKATDPNGDPMKYVVYLRRVDSPYWLELQKDVSSPMMMWDPRSAPDGRYELKVIASDELANPAGMGLTETRISDPFIVDNTPPVVQNLSCKLIEKDKLLIQAQLSDEMSEIDGAWISINAGKDWQYIAPADEIYDTKNEKIDGAVPLKEDSVKPLMITIKVTDTAGNTGYSWKLVQ